MANVPWCHTCGKPEGLGHCVGCLGTSMPTPTPVEAERERIMHLVSELREHVRFSNAGTFTPTTVCDTILSGIDSVTDDRRTPPPSAGMSDREHELFKAVGQYFYESAPPPGSNRRAKLEDNMRKALAAYQKDPQG